MRADGDARLAGIRATRRVQRASTHLIVRNCGNGIRSRAQSRGSEISMPKKTDAIEDVINAAVAQVAARILPAIERALAEAGARAAQPRAAKAKPVHRRGRRRAPEELTRWVADNRARRVPKFVIEATGLDTKKKIVAKYGADAAFEKGKPLPRQK